MTLSQLTVVDYLIALIVIVSVVISLIRGFAREALSLLTWMAAVWVTYAFATRLSEALPSFIQNNALRMGLSIAALFLITLAAGIAISYILAKFINKSGLSGTDRLVGIVFGTARGLLLVALGIIGVGFTTLAQSPSWKTSTFIPYFKPLTTYLAKDLPDYAKHQGKQQLQDSQKQANDKMDDALA